LICRVGVTGHRPKRLRANAADLGVLRQRVDEVLTAIAAAVADVRHRDRRTPFSDEATLLRLVSPLAEGSDRLVARAGLELSPTSYDLQCVFPFAADVYRRDFIERTEWEHPGSADEFDELRGHASAVLELDSDPAAPNAYVAVGLTTVRQSDVLLAIWDQGEAQGPGGTPEIVLEALHANVPVIGIDARRQQDHAIAFIELRHGKVLWGGWSLAELSEKLHTVFALPASHMEHDHDPVAPVGRIDLAQALFDEPATPAPATTLYGRVTSWAARLTGDAEFRPLLSDDLDQLVHAPALPLTEEDEPQGGLLTKEVQRDVAASFRSKMLRDLVARLEGAIGAAYTWTDLQANRYAALHRRHVSRSTLLMIPIAIVAGFVVQRCFNAEMIGDGWSAVTLRIGLSFVELGCIVAIFDSYVTVREQRYHDRWLDYRSIAEKLRHIIMLLPLGRPGIDAELPPTLGENDARAHWTNWYVRAVTREAGVLSGRLFDPEYRQACHALLRHWLLRGQMRYHFHAAVRAHAPLHLLHKYRYVIFTFLVLSPVVDFVTEPIPEAHHSVRLLIECIAELFFFCVPAIFGSLYAFTRLSDFENIEVRSRAELQRLMRVDRELSEQSDQSSVDLLRATSMTSHAMLAELVEWRVAAALRKPELGG
jgi:hypothetical protein